MFGFPKVDRPSNFKHDKTYLKNVTFQIDFEKNKGIISEENLSKLRDKLKGKYKNIRSIKSQPFEVKFDNNSPNISSSEVKIIGIEFRNDSNTEVVTITEDKMNLTILGINYSCFHDYKENIKNTFIDTLVTSGISHISNLTIRKTNVFELAPKEDAVISEYMIQQLIFNSVLVDNISYLPPHNYLKSNINNTSFNVENYELILRYGLLPSNNSPNVFQLLLDITMSKQNNNLTTEIIDELEIINSEIYNIFHWSLQDDVISHLLTNN